MAASGTALQEALEKMEGYPITTAVKWEMSEPDTGGQEQQESGPVELGQGLGGAIGGLLGNKIKQMVQKQGDGSPGMRTSFGSRSEIISVRAEKIAPIRLEDPKSYRLME